jgi:cold shock CspA family protein
MEKIKGFIQTVILPRGYGFVQPIDEDKGIFFYRNAVLEPTFEELKEGLPVQFITINTPRGRKAIGIERIKTE